MIEEQVFYKKLLMKMFKCDEDKIKELVELLNKAIPIFGELNIDNVITDIIESLDCKLDVSIMREDIIYSSLCAGIKEIANINDMSEALAQKLLDCQNIGSQVHFVPEDFNDFEIKEHQKSELANKFNKFLELKAELEREK